MQRNRLYEQVTYMYLSILPPLQLDVFSFGREFIRAPLAKHSTRDSHCLANLVR